MSSVGAGFSMSLDGYIAGPNDDVERLFSWMFSGQTAMPISTGDQDMELKLSQASLEQLQESYASIGAIVSGRRMFDVAGAWGGKHPMNVPVVVLTHNIPQEWVEQTDSPFHFVTSGVEEAVELARELAKGKRIGVGGADLTRQCLKAGLLDTIHIDLVPVILGGGVRLFESIGIEPIELKLEQITAATDVTHLTFQVLR